MSLAVSLYLSLMEEVEGPSISVSQYFSLMGDEEEESCDWFSVCLSVFACVSLCPF